MLKDSSGKPGLSKLPTAVRNKMGYMKKGGTVSKDKESAEVKMAGGGLYANIAAKKKRIAAGSGEHMRKVGSKGAPTKDAFIQSAKTAKPVKPAKPVKRSTRSR